MPLIGLILIAAAVVVGIELVLANKAPMTVHLWKWDWNIHAWGLAAWGAAILLVALVGWWLIWRGTKRRLRKRRERRALAAENAELAERAEATPVEDERPPWGTETSNTNREPTTVHEPAADTRTSAYPRPAGDPYPSSPAAGRETTTADATAAAETPTSAYPRPAGDPYQSAPQTTAYPGHPQLNDPPPEQPQR